MFFRQIDDGYLEIVDDRGEVQATAYGIFSASEFVKGWYKRIMSEVRRPRAQQRARKGISTWKPNEDHL